MVYDDGSSRSKIQKIQDLYKENYIKHAGGPIAWLEDSIIDHLVIGTVNPDTQPYLSRLFQTQEEDLLIYFSESKQFKFQGKSNLEDFLEDSLIQEDEEDFITSKVTPPTKPNLTKAYFSTDFFKQVPEFEQLLREQDFSYIRLYFRFLQQLMFGIIGYIILICLFIPLCIPQLAPYRVSNPPPLPP